jgi:hypothetical protein
MNAIQISRVPILIALAITVLISAISSSHKEDFVNETIGPGLSYTLYYGEKGNVREFCLKQRLKTQTPFIDTTYYKNGDSLDFTIDTLDYINLSVNIRYNESGNPIFIETIFGNDVPQTRISLKGDGSFEEYSSYLINHYGTSPTIEIEEIKKQLHPWSKGVAIEGNIDGRQILFDDSGKVKKSYLYDYGQLSR